MGSMPRCSLPFGMPSSCCSLLLRLQPPSVRLVVRARRVDMTRDAYIVHLLDVQRSTHVLIHPVLCLSLRGSRGDRLVGHESRVWDPPLLLLQHVGGRELAQQGSLLGPRRSGRCARCGGALGSGVAQQQAQRHDELEDGAAIVLLLVTVGAHVHGHVLQRELV